MTRHLQTEDDMAGERHAVFVYGTLRRGGCYHETLAGSRFLKKVRTEPEYTLIDLGAYPGMLPSGNTSVAGEIYEVDDEVLRRLDELEECPDLFIRARVALLGQDAVWGYLYRGGVETEIPCITSGDWFAR